MDRFVIGSIQYAIAFIIVYVVFPKFIFATTEDTALARFFARFIKMNALVMLIGYVLVITKTFELSVWLLVLLVLAFKKPLWFMRRNKSDKKISEWKLWIYDYFDGLIKIPSLMRTRIASWLREKKSQWMQMDTATLLHHVQCGVVFLYASYLRFYDVVVHAAPAMSDAYVTLAWIKYINQSILFHDGIYPQGFHIHQALLQNFSGLDPLHILRLTGPLSTLLIAVALYFFSSRVFQSKIAGLIAFAIYGIFPVFLPIGPDRQVATNSQEYAFIFIWPTLYFFYAFFQEKQKRHLFLGVIGLAVIGLTHTFALLFAGFGLAMLFIAVLIGRDPSRWEAIKKVTLMSVWTIPVIAFPLLTGLIMGRSFHQASATFLTAQAQYFFIPQRGPVDYAVLIGIVLLFGTMFFQKLKEKWFAIRFIILFGGTSWVLYTYGGQMTQSLLIESRANELYSMIAPLLIAASVAMLIKLLNTSWQNSAWPAWVALLILVGTVGVMRPSPIIPYKMEYDSKIDQYLRISQTFRATEWIMISQEEGYALAYGKGWHMMVGDFLQLHTGTEKRTISGSIGSMSMNVPHVFLFVEKQVYETYQNIEALQPGYERRKEEAKQLDAWIDHYRKEHDNIDLFYEDETIAVYHIIQHDAQREMVERVMGPLH